MLRSAGHARVQVLNGGIAPAIAAGVPVSSGPEQAVEKNPYPVSGWQLGLAGILEVEQAISDPGRLVIDVRDACRYNGESEPIDLVAGHIPGAVNIPLTTNLEADGFFKSPAELNQNYTRALNGRDPRAVIVHCGSGVTACHTLLAMAYAGMEIPCLYVGSWSEWSRTGRPVGRS
jgi:thiosulfate/3-mercaptopyruvate sulfurtransferase